MGFAILQVKFKLLSIFNSHFAKNMAIRFEIINHSSPEYWMTLLLRYKILRHPLGLNYAKRDLKKEASDVHFGAFEEDVLYACLILSQLNDNVFKLRQVAVDETLQGTGIGKALQQFAEQFAINNGCRKIVCNARKSAVPFYEKQGFEKLGEEFEEVGIPHFYMEKELIPLD